VRVKEFVVFGDGGNDAPFRSPELKEIVFAAFLYVTAVSAAGNPDV